MEKNIPPRESHCIISKIITAFWFGFVTGDRLESDGETLNSF